MSGEAAPRPILALHGFTGSGDDFEALWPHVGAEGWAPDLVGHTPDLPRAAAAYRMEAEVERLAGKMGETSERWVVVGYSMGGRVALHLAAAHPERVAALVLVGATPGLATAAERQARREADEALATRILSAPVADFLHAWAKVPIIASQARIASPWRERMQARKARLTGAGLAASLRGMGTGAMPSLWGRLPQVPMLLVTGAEDVKFTEIAARMVAEAEARVPAQQVVIPEAGHCAHLEQPARVGAVIRDFLAGLSGDVG